MPTPNTANAALGVGYLYFGDADEAQPATAPGPDGAAPTGFVYIGGTLEGVSLNFEREITDHYFEESSAQVASAAGNSTFSIEAQLGEMTLANWKTALGGGSIASSVLTLSDELDIVSLYLDMPAGGNDRRTVYIPRAVSVGSLSVNLRRAEALQSVTASFRSQCVLSEIKVKDHPAA